MEKITLLLAALFFLAFTSAYGREFAGVSIPETYTMDGQTLKINACALRTRFFFKIYACILYTPDRITKASTLYQNDLPKVICMHFIYHRVSADQMRDAFASALDRNNDGFSRTADGRAFLKVFSFNLFSGDLLDLAFHANGVLAISHNGVLITTFHSAALNHAVLAVFLGHHPNKRLKEGVLACA